VEGHEEQYSEKKKLDDTLASSANRSGQQQLQRQNSGRSGHDHLTSPHVIYSLTQLTFNSPRKK